MLLLLASAPAGSAASSSSSSSSSAIAQAVAPTLLSSVVHRPSLAEGVGPCAPVALMILMNGSGLLDVFPRPLRHWQLRHCSFDVVKELVPQSAHEDDDGQPLKHLTPTRPVGVVDCHHRHPQPHEPSILAHDSLSVLTNGLLLVLRESSKDVRCLFQQCPSYPPLLKLVLEVGEGREHPASGSIVLHDP